MKVKPKKLFIQIFTLSLVVVIIFSVIPYVSAKTRRNYIIDFIISNRIGNDGFSNSFQTNTTVSYEATYYALKILDDLNSLQNQPDLDIFEEELAKEVETELDSLDEYSLTKLYYLLHSLELLDGFDKVTSTQKAEISTWINNSKAGSGGYGNNNSTSPSVIYTFYAANIMLLIQNTGNIPEGDSHTNYVLTCFNSDGGFGGTISAESSIPSTYYAVTGVNGYSELSDLSVQNESCIDYIRSFYVLDSSDSENYGGFSETQLPNKSLISTTYYCALTLQLLDSSELNSQATSQWILSHQNLNDGGFVDSAEKDIVVYSSIKSTYFAFSIIKLFDVSLLSLNENFWDVETNWLILIFILLVLFTGIVAIGLYIWRKRQL
jgi:prenyltransferase beta subunit